MNRSRRGQAVVTCEVRMPVTGRLCGRPKRAKRVWQHETVMLWKGHLNHYEREFEEHGVGNPRADLPIKLSWHTRDPGERMEYYLDPDNGYIRVHGNGCWVWQKASLPAGYGLCKSISNHGDRDSNQLVHRLSWAHHTGEIPDGLEVDHLCRNKACCNPDHLECVKPKENSRRGKWDRDRERMYEGQLAKALRRLKNERAKVRRRDARIAELEAQLGL